MQGHPIIRIASFEEARALYPGTGQSPFAVPITPQALYAIASTVGSLPPETGGKLYSPLRSFGVDLFEFDMGGSAASSRGVYRPDAVWGDERAAFHITREEPQTRVWIGDLHSHPGFLGYPSPKAGHAKGDLGFAEAVLEANPHLDYYLMPIVARSKWMGDVVIYPWVVIRGTEYHRLVFAEMVVVDAASFPAWPDATTPVTTTIKKGKYYERLEGLVSLAFHDKRIAVVGVGAGSDMVLKLARMGPRSLTLVDFDRVEAPNLARTAYTMDDLGVPKVEALKRHIERANPFVEVSVVDKDVTSLSELELASVFQHQDLVIAGTDSFAAQALTNQVSQRYQVPGVFIGIHEGGRGGIVVGTIPSSKTGCLRCAVPSRYEAAAKDGARAVELPGARGLMVDVAFIDAVALKLAIAILERGAPTPTGKLIEQLKGRTSIVIRTSPEYRFEGGLDLWHDVIFGDLPREPKDFRAELEQEVFFAMDTAFLSLTRNPACVDCGDATSAP